LKLQGLINISGFHVDPGYRGNLIFAVKNVGPHDIVLKYEEPAFMIMWAVLAEGARKDKKSNYENIPVELMAQLGGGSVTLARLHGVPLDRVTVAMAMLKPPFTAIGATKPSITIAAAPARKLPATTRNVAFNFSSAGDIVDIPLRGGRLLTNSRLCCNCYFAAPKRFSL
jgi:hypothetical protein